MREEIPMNLLKKIGAVLNRIEEYFLIFGMGTMFVAVILQVFFRYFLNSPLVWTEPYARYMYLWVVYIGISFGVRNNRHIRVTFLYSRFPRLLQKTVYVLVNLAFIVLVLMQIGPALIMIRGYMRIQAPGLPIRMGWIYYAVPIGYVTASIRLLIDSYLMVRDDDHPNLFATAGTAPAETAVEA